MGAEPSLKIFDYRLVDKADEYEDIPILDAGPYLAGAPGAREALAENIRFIQETIGFYVIINHGVPRALMDNAYANLERFFALSDEEKLKLKFGEKSVGYVAAKSTVYVTSKINENTKQDLNETLVTALERPADHPYLEQGLRFVGPNKWPENLPGFREAIVEFQKIDRRSRPQDGAAICAGAGKTGGLFRPVFRRTDYVDAELPLPSGGTGRKSVRNFATQRPQLLDAIALVRCAGTSSPDPHRQVAAGRSGRQRHHRQYRRVPEPLDQ